MNGDPAHNSEQGPPAPEAGYLDVDTLDPETMQAFLARVGALMGRRAVAGAPHVPGAPAPQQRPPSPES